MKYFVSFAYSKKGLPIQFTTNLELEDEKLETMKDIVSIQERMKKELGYETCAIINFIKIK